MQFQLILLPLALLLSSCPFGGKDTVVSKLEIPELTQPRCQSFSMPVGDPVENMEVIDGEVFYLVKQTMRCHQFDYKRRKLVGKFEFVEPWEMKVLSGSPLDYVPPFWQWVAWLTGQSEDFNVEEKAAFLDFMTDQLKSKSKFLKEGGKWQEDLEELELDAYRQLF